MYSKLAHVANYQQIKRTEKDIKYIVIHYTGNNGDTARNNLNFFHENIVKASAHFFVDDNEICCSVPWYFRAWHCGTSGEYVHPDCRNHNSLGIELCSRKTDKGTYYFTDAVFNRAAEFVAQQMKNYNIPIENVIRHYDVTGKFCPRPFIDRFAWDEFKEKVMDYFNPKVVKELVYYESLNQIPAGEQREVVSALVNRGIIKGNNSGLHLSSDMTRMLVYLTRAGVLKI